MRQLSGIDKPVVEIASTYLLGLPKDKRLTYDFHQESNYMKGFDDIINVHYPIFRSATPVNGTMSVLARSPKLGTLPYTKTRVAQNSYTSLIPVNMPGIATEYAETHLHLDQGDCVFFHKDLIHRSNFNSSNLCRPIGISRLSQSLGGDFVNRRPEEL